MSYRTKEELQKKFGKSYHYRDSQTMDFGDKKGVKRRFKNGAHRTFRHMEKAALRELMNGRYDMPFPQHMKESSNVWDVV